MQNSIRYNRIIAMPENNQIVSGTDLVSNDSSNDLTYIADSAYDMVMIKTEHDEFSFESLKATLTNKNSEENPNGI